MLKSVMLVLSLAVGASLNAQTPPSPFYTGGVINQCQSSNPTNGNVAGKQRLECHIGVGDQGSMFGGAYYGIKIGHRVWWSTDSLQPGVVSPVTLHPTGSTFAIFGICNWNFINGTMPGAATGHDQIFVDPASLVTVNPNYTETALTSGGAGAFIPTGGFDRFWLYWDVPNDPAIIGAIVGMQTLRLDFSNNLWYLSNEHVLQIVQ